ncbi:helix-turn-helix transcriptional regulator [Streptomyces xiamenensis]|uniref:LuxR family transcriptional regulator n=1 Tax=Streptomyces xiamenensis TaxID=408015 RepID=A0A0F7FYS3_9ACTN|nr:MULTISPECIES: helix-turn-helix transcriptional regulator [Streptomyces]AKG45710.1 LuxR family transcriptional regulator [Streptomyces xiamenensis]
MQIRSVSPVFVGRDKESAALDRALREADDGTPQAVLIGGEAGVGKTRLLEEALARAARDTGALTVVGACVEAGADGLPFAPVSTLLRGLHRRFGDELTQAAAGFGDELARLLPELGEPTALPAPAGTEEGRGRLFELTARLLETLAGTRTLVLAIEDLHWSDRSTRELLSYLFRSLPRGRVLLLMTYRSDDIHRRHPLRPFLAELDRLRTVRRIELERFTVDEVRRQLAGIHGSEPRARVVEQVYARSDGNAFFVEELAGCLKGDEPPGMISDSVRDLLLVRVEALPETVQRVIRIAARGGSRVEHALLRAVVPGDEDELIEALRTAVGANLLRVDEDDSYRFRHALVREAVIDDLLPGERSRLSRRYAEALEADPALVCADERPARLAGFWYQANDPVKALPATLRAADAARGRHAYAEQLRMLDRVLELWDSVPAEIRTAQRPARDVESYPLCDCVDETLAHLDLLAEITLTARLAGEPERGLSVARRALRIIVEPEHPLRAAWFWSQTSRLLRHLARGTGWEELKRAQALLAGFDPSPTHAHVLTEAATWGVLFDAGPDALETARQAVDLARAMGNEEAELHALVSLGGLMTETGAGEEGIAVMRAAAERVQAGHHVNVFTRSHVNLQSVLETVGRSRESLEVGEEALKLTDRWRLRQTAVWLHRNRGDALYSLGRWDDAATAGRTAAADAASPVNRALSAEFVAQVALARGEYEVAEAEIAVMTEQYNAYDRSVQHAHPAARCKLLLAAARGRILDARELFAAAVAAGLAPGAGSYTWPLVHAAAVAEADAAGVSAAAPGRAEAIGLIRTYAAGLRRHYPVWQAHAELVEAELRRAEGTVRAADWAAVIAALEGLERPYLLAQARAHGAETLLADGDREGAGALLIQAYEAARALGAAPLMRGVELLAQRARLPLAPAAGPGTAGRDDRGLTRRERDVLALVAAGRSNRQIAQELFISPKTASVHVSHILAKLEVSGRGEAAALAHRLGLLTEERVTPAR